MADVEELEIKIKVDESEVKKAIKDETPVKEIPQTGGQGIADKFTTATDMAGGALGNITGALGAGTAMATTNPKQAIMTAIPQMLTRFLPKLMPKLLTRFIPVVGAALLAVELVPMLVKTIANQLTAVGSPFDKRYRRIIKKEVNGFATREQQQRQRLGLDPVIITSVGGFRNNGGLQTVNTLNQVRETGTAAIGLQDKALGVQP